MKAQNINLLARAGAELALRLEETTAYPDRPDELLGENYEAASVITEIFFKLVFEGASIPGPIAYLVSHLQRVHDIYAMKDLAVENEVRACP